MSESETGLKVIRKIEGLSPKPKGRKLTLECVMQKSMNEKDLRAAMLALAETHDEMWLVMVVVKVYTERRAMDFGGWVAKLTEAIPRQKIWEWQTEEEIALRAGLYQEFMN